MLERLPELPPARHHVAMMHYWPFMELWLKNRPRGLGIVNYASDVHPNLVSVDDGMDAVRRRLEEAFAR